MQSSTIAIQMNDRENKLNSDAMLSEDFPDATFTNTLHTCRSILDEGFVDLASFQSVPPVVPMVKVERQRQSFLKGGNGDGSLEKALLNKPRISPSLDASKQYSSRPSVHSSLPEETMVSFIDEFNPFHADEEQQNPSRGSSLNDVSKFLPETRNAKAVKGYPGRKNNSTRTTMSPSLARKERSSKSRSQRKASRSPNGIRSTESKSRVTSSRWSDSSSEDKRLSKSRSPHRNGNETRKTSANKMKERREPTNNPDQSGEEDFIVIKSSPRNGSSKSDLDQKSNVRHSGSVSENPGSEQSVGKTRISLDESELEDKDDPSAILSVFPNAFQTDDDCWLDVPKKISLGAVDPVFVQPREETDSVETRSCSLGTKETRSSSKSNETRSSSKSNETRSSSKSNETRSSSKSKDTRSSFKSKETRSSSRSNEAISRASSKSSTRRKCSRSSSDKNLLCASSVKRDLLARSTSLRDMGQPYGSTLSSSFSSFQREVRTRLPRRDPHPNHLGASQRNQRENSTAPSRTPRGVPRCNTWGNDGQSALSEQLSRTRSVRETNRGTSTLGSSSTPTSVENHPIKTGGTSFRMPKRNRSGTQLSVLKKSVEGGQQHNICRNLPKQSSCSKLRLHNEQLKQRLSYEIAKSTTTHPWNNMEHSREPSDERDHNHHHHSTRHTHGHSSNANGTSEADNRRGRATRGGGAASRRRSSSADAAKNYQKRCNASAASRRALARAKDKKVADPET